MEARHGSHASLNIMNTSNKFDLFLQKKHKY